MAVAPRLRALTTVGFRAVHCDPRQKHFVSFGIVPSLCKNSKFKQVCKEIGSTKTIPEMSIVACGLFYAVDFFTEDFPWRFYTASAQSSHSLQRGGRQDCSETRLLRKASYWRPAVLPRISRARHCFCPKNLDLSASDRVLSNSVSKRPVVARRFA